MQTSRFQLGLIATLAVGLGFSLSSSDAVGYPAGAAVSMGANPVWAFGGTLFGATEVVLNAPAGQDMIVTDVMITSDNSYERAYLTLEDGTLVLSQGVRANSGIVQPVSHQFSSGIRVPAGTHLSLGTQWGGALDYTLSGYYAQP